MTDMMEHQVVIGKEPFPAICLSNGKGEEDSALIRALIHDNMRDAKRIVELFTHNYGTSHPLGLVYEPQFWLTGGATNDDEDEITSVVAVHNNAFVAHLALKQNAAPDTLEIMLPAIRPDYRNELFRIYRSLWWFVIQQAKRQQRHTIIQYHSTVWPIFQLISSKCFRTYEVAIVPVGEKRNGKTVESSTRSFKDGSLLTASILCDEAEITPLSLYPPLRHALVIEELYREMQLPRSINYTPANGKPCLTFAEPHGAARQRPLVMRREQLGLAELRVSPSLVHKNCLDDIDVFASDCASRGIPFAIQVSLNDPCCPAFCEALESLGYRFCGILPYFGNSDYVIYSQITRSELREMRIYSKRARGLRDYMLSFD